MKKISDKSELWGAVMKEKRFVLLSVCVIFMLILGGCGKVEQEHLTVYSFSGENEQFSVSNGVIILTDTDEIFSGGNLKITGNSIDNITSYSTTFYIISRDGDDIILSNSVGDMTGGTVNVSGDLGKVSGDGIISKQRADDIITGDLKNNLYFELTTIDKFGEESVYQLQMSLVEVTKNTNS